LLGAALLALGLKLPAKGSAALDASGANESVLRGAARLRSLKIGDELELARSDGTTYVYEVAALDVVDAARAELGGTDGENTVVIVTCWPFDAVDVAGDWRYVVTARLVGSNPAAVASAASF
jgi:sortase (surface protein transpeptidase)